MLTRVEIDGFKSFEGFELALPPFAVILGPNASGKSNLFDALRLLSRLATTDVRSAMRELRGEPNELFRHLPDGSVMPRMKIAVEVLFDPEVEDDYGQKIKLACTRLRYEIILARREVNGIERFYVEHERAVPIRKDQDRWEPYGKVPTRAFRSMFMRYPSRHTAYLDTVTEDGRAEFQIFQDRRQGRPRPIPAVEAERSVLSTITLAREFAHLYALQRELSRLRYLQLDPAAERRSSPPDAPEVMERDGGNLAAVLYRIEQETRSQERPRGALADIIADLAEIVPGVTDLLVERDDERREYRLRLTMRDGQPFSARVVSDGTWRVLALLALLHDPRHRGVLCFEEPENGVHKARLERLMEYLQESCADTAVLEIDKAAPLQQIIVNTHSIVAARAVKRSIIRAEMVDQVGGGIEVPRRLTRMVPYRLSEQGSLPGVADGDDGRVLQEATIMKIEADLELAEARSEAA